MSVIVLALAKSDHKSLLSCPFCALFAHPFRFVGAGVGTARSLVVDTAMDLTHLPSNYQLFWYISFLGAFAAVR